MSHIKALSLAKKKKWKNFIIVEDDFIFLLPRQRILHMLKSMNDYKWDVIMLAKGHSQIINTKSDFIKKVDYSTTTSGYICNSNFIDVLYDNFFESFKLLEKEVNESKEIKIYTTKYALDQHWFSL
jgi:GR25 family glycosyltransferase involved in LPS biosynthesis